MKPKQYLFLLLCFLSYSLSAQQRISGKVSDASGLPISGVNLTINTDGGKRPIGATATNGDYSIQVPANVTELIFSYTGMVTKIEKINGRTVINVQLQQENNQLDGVVITALGIKREAKALSYSRQSMDVSTLTDAPSTNIVSSLSGRIAGVQVTPASSNTGSARVIIRGNNSITGNNQPLFVIDGIPVDNETGDARVSASSNHDNLDYGNISANINPEDVESIEILKGPNAAALYGSRAANGAILITTKKSKGDKLKISFNSNSTFQAVSEFPALQNMFGAGNSFKLEGSGSTNNAERIPDLRVYYRSWGPPMLGQRVISINGQTKEYLAQPGNVNEFYQTASMLTNSLAVEGGNPQNNYRFSYTNYSGGSIMAGVNENTRHNANIRVFNAFTKWLDFDSKITFQQNTVKNRQYMNGSNRNPMYQYNFMVRDDIVSEFENYKDEYGNETGTHREFSNPYWLINENINKDTKNQLQGAFNINAKLTNWLKLTAKIGTEMYWLNGFAFNNKGAMEDPTGKMNTINNTLSSSNSDLVLFANNKVGKISINSFVGVGRFQTSNTKNSQRINSLIQAGLINLSNSSEFPEVSQFESKKIINSVYGSTSLAYNNYLYLDITARNDWSSTLPAVNNSYFYPSIGGSFIFTDAFKINKNILTFGKLRASYAIVGNDTSPYQLIPTYSFNGIYNNQAYASLSSTFFNPDLKPEKTGSLEYGIDLRFLKDRIDFSATHYRSATTNQIITAQVTPSSGYTRRYYNAGEIANWGTELTLSGAPIKTKNFGWNVLLNYAKNNSEVVSLIDGVNSFQLNALSVLVFAEVGQPYNIIRGTGWKRDAQGRKLVSADGKPLLDNNMYLGNSLPDWTGGFGNTFRYKNFNLNFLVDVRKGGRFISGSYRRGYTSGARIETLEGREATFLHSYIYGESSANLTGGFIFKDAFFEDGRPNNKYISAQSNGSSDAYSESIFDASYVKLREAVLSYNVPSSWLKKTFVSGAKIGLSGRNLWTIYKKSPIGIDPESSVTSGNGQGIENGSLPPMVTYGLDIKLTF